MALRPSRVLLIILGAVVLGLTEFGFLAAPGRVTPPTKLGVLPFRAGDRRLIRSDISGVGGMRGSK